MRFLTLALMLAAVAVTTTNADVVVEDETQAEAARTTKKPNTNKQARKAAKLSPEELQKKKDEKKRRSRKLESCLILTRAYYSQNVQMFKNFVDGHGSTRVAADESDANVKKQAKQNQQSLVAVLNADQLIQCEENITDEQIAHIQKQKAAGITDDLKMSGKMKRLVKVSFVKYDDHGVSGGKPAPIRLQPQQDAILNMIQEISDTLAKTAAKSGSRSGLGLGYLDMSNSITAQLVYLVGLVAFIGFFIQYFYNKTVVKQEAENAKIQARKDEKKAKKDKKKAA